MSSHKSIESPGWQAASLPLGDFQPEILSRGLIVRCDATLLLDHAFAQLSRASSIPALMFTPNQREVEEKELPMGSSSHQIRTHALPASVRSFVFVFARIQDG
jgi:hypothetical protein